MTRNPQYLRFLQFGPAERDVDDRGEKGELRMWWTMVTFVLVYLIYVFEKAIW